MPVGGVNLKTIHELQDNLHTLAEQLSIIVHDLEEIKEAYINPETFLQDEYIKIEEKAQVFPIVNKKLKQAHLRERQTYMRFLSIVAGADDAKLLMARRIGVGIGSEWDVERLVLEGLTVPANFPVEVEETLIEFRYSLLLDSLVIAHLSEEVDKETIAMIVEMADILKCEEGSVAIVAQVAAAIVQMDKELFDTIVCQKPFSGLSHLIPPEWLKRVYVGRFSKDKHFRIVKSGWVKKGQELVREREPNEFALSIIKLISLFTDAANASDATQKENKLPSAKEPTTVKEPTTIKAPISGIVVFGIKKKNSDSIEEYVVYICSPFDSILE